MFFYFSPSAVCGPVCCGLRVTALLLIPHGRTIWYSRKPLWYYSISHLPELSHPGVPVYSTSAPLAAVMIFSIAPIGVIAPGGALKKLERHDEIRLSRPHRSYSTGGGGVSFVECLGHVTVDHASLSRRSTVPAPNRDTSNTWALITILFHTRYDT